MSTAALDMLFARLLWPPPRIRWEVARGLAGLIRSGDRAAANGLTEWLGTRRLESEAAMGLGIIQAFDLGPHFDAGTVAEAVRAPSHLSDWLLRRAFPKLATATASGRPFAPQTPAVLPDGQEAWFERYRTWAVPRAFSSELQRLEETSGLPFMDRWRHEWRWLQVEHVGAAAEYPLWFSGGSRDRRGQFDLQQRELYVSAYLRTLAFAVVHWQMPIEVAEEYSRLGLSFNRGLADLEPIARPEWTFGLGAREPAAFADTARIVRDAARAMANSNERVVAIRAADLTDATTFEMDLRLVAGPRGLRALRPEAAELKHLTPRNRPGELGGDVGSTAHFANFHFDEPWELTQGLWPTDVGRTHTEIIPIIRLASPYVFGQRAELQCGAQDIRLKASDGVLSRWVHWYAEWEPTLPTVADSCVGGVTTVSAQALDALIRAQDLDLAWLVTARIARRRESYLDLEPEVRTAWLGDDG